MAFQRRRVYMKAQVFLDFRRLKLNKVEMYIENRMLILITLGIIIITDS